MPFPKPPRRHKAEDDDEPVSLDLSAVEEYDLEIRLFEEYEMPIFIEQMEACGVTPSDTLYALHSIFWLGYVDTSNFCIQQGSTPAETAKLFYDAIDKGVIKAELVAERLQTVATLLKTEFDD